MDDCGFEEEVRAARSKIAGECLLDGLIEINLPTPAALNSGHFGENLADLVQTNTSVVPFV